MPDEQPDRQKRLEESLRRVQEALDKGHAPRAQAIESLITAAGARAIEKINQGMDRRKERDRKREAKRRERELRANEPSWPQGLVMAAAAAISMYFALTTPGLFWMLFVAFGFAMAAADQLGKELSRRRRTAEAARAAALSEQARDATEARIARLDAVAAKILAEVASASPAVREVIQRPERTVEALKAASRELARRERELRRAVNDEDDRRLQAERADLASRVAAENDAVVRARLDAALKALDAQLAQRSILATAASRLEAEATRIVYTLENLYTQILRARAADAVSADVAGAGLRRSLEQVSEEMDAVAAALESVHRDDAAIVPVAPVAAPETAPPLPDGLRSRS